MMCLPVTGSPPRCLASVPPSARWCRRSTPATCGFCIRRRVSSVTRVPRCRGAAVPVRWTEIAATTGAVIHPTVEWFSLLPAGTSRGAGDGKSTVWDDAPEIGDMSEQQFAALAAVLAEYTATPDDCWPERDDYADATSALNGRPVTYLRRKDTPQQPEELFTHSLNSGYDASPYKTAAPVPRVRRPRLPKALPQSRAGSPGRSRCRE